MLKIIDHGPVREIRLDRPPVNALGPELVPALDSAIQQAAEECGAIVLSGREGLFSAGLDVPALLQLDRQGMMGFWGAFFGLLETVARSEAPIVAAITGHSPAGGAVISLYCDYRVMASGSYRIGLNETQVGLIIPRQIQLALERLVGPHRAERLVVAGAMLSPDEAAQAGLVDELAEDPEATVAAALDWCQRHLALPSHSMLGNRHMMRQPLHALFDGLTEADLETFVNGWFWEDTQTTLRALVASLKKK